MATHPEFPQFKPIKLEDRDFIQEILWKYQPHTSWNLRDDKLKEKESISMSISSLASVLIILLLLFLLISVSVVTGRPFRLANLPDEGANWGCATCHVNPAGGGVRNAFGEDYEEIAIPAGDTYTKELGQTDSDGDGFTNDEEFNAETPTEPWNSNSHPPRVPQAVKPHGKKFTTWGKLKRR
jgi:hypothetical protein